jgi:putative oxidoreductase
MANRYFLAYFAAGGLHATAMGFEKLELSPGILWGTLAGCGEFFGGLLVLLGMATRLGALSILVAMGVATLKVHWGFFFLPRGMEYALTLMDSALGRFVSGGGHYPSIRKYLVGLHKKGIRTTRAKMYN